jgi:hypothetical protein
MGFFSGLCWNLEKPSTRRGGFPSWSWTGWEDPVVRWEYEKYQWEKIRVDNDIQVLVKTSSGQLINVEESYQLQTRAQPATHLSNLIQITAWVSSMRIKKRISWRGESEYEAKIKLEDGGRVFWRFKPTTSAKISPEREAIGIHLAYKSESVEHPEATASALLVVGKVDTIYERLGFGWVDQGHYDRFDKTGKDFRDHESGFRITIYHRMKLEPLGLVRSLKTITLG